LRARLKPFLYEYNGKNKPDFLRCQWKYTIQNKPDCYINDVKNSVILEVKAAEIVTSENFATDCTLRFGRNIKIRYDK
jgi:ATP-dependent DNA ligase